ncbi:plasmid pRiA4b ORF-3 family protein, partial [Patescibacteria group bacterium]|nr:plasmid pRiA4b ORF-3 family protein [Patescibacteria group bacterium]
KIINMKTYIFEITLLCNPKILREIEILENSSLYKLAKTIIKSYNFDFDHCFGFFNKIADNYFDSKKKYELFTDLIEEGMEDIEPTGAGNVKKTKINEVWQNINDKMIFLFDYGDNWKFIVKLVIVNKKDAKKKYPRIIKRIGRAPKQY